MKVSYIIERINFLKFHFPKVSISSMKNILTIVLLLIFTIGVKAKNDSLEITKISNRLKNLEDYKANIDKLYEAKYQELKNEQAKFEATYFQKQEWWHLLLAFITGGSVIGYSYLRKYYKEMFDAQLKPLFEGKSELMQSIIEKYDKELSIRREKKILVIAKTSNQFIFSELKTIFKRDNVNQEIYTDFNDELLDKIKQVDLVILDDVQEINTNLMFVKQIPKNIKVFVYKIQLQDSETLERIGSASLPTQVVPNIMNLLKYN